MPNVTNQQILDTLKANFAEGISEVNEPNGLLTFTTVKEQWIPLVSFLRDDPTLQFGFLTDLTGVHYPEHELPLGVVIHLHSLVNHIRVRVKVFLPIKNPRIPSLTPLFKGANWMERETYDFFGIIFEGHPDLRRILNMDDMVAFPMRKEFPLEDPNRKDKEDEYFGR